MDVICWIVSSNITVLFNQDLFDLIIDSSKLKEIRITKDGNEHTSWFHTQ